MEISGSGMIARALQPYHDQLEDVVAFARGVSNSAETEAAQYEREFNLLVDTVKRCKTEGRRIVYFSSGGTIYGDFDGVRIEETVLSPTTAYGRQQLTCETMIVNSGVRYCITRLANLVGAGQNPHQLIPALVQQAVDGHAHLFKQASRDILDVDDFARLLVQVLSALKQDQSEIVNIACGHSLPVMAMFAEIEAILGKSAEIELIDKGDVQQFSIDKLQRILEGDVRFDADYPLSVLRKYVPVFAGALL